MVFYYKCQRLLLYPQIAKKDVAHKYLKGCALACAGVCGAYKRLHQALAVGYSTMALQTVFMSGLTLVYCLWFSPENVFDTTTSNGIHDCSVVLFVIAERVPAAKRYRNTFEVIRQRVIDRISAMGPTERRSRETVPGLSADLAASRSFLFEPNYQTEAEGCFDVNEEALDQLSHILTDMAGDYNTGPLDHVFNDVLPSSFSNNCGFGECKGSPLAYVLDEAQLQSALVADDDTFNTSYLSSYNQHLDFDFQ
jgi:hypothetical protein